MFRHALIAAPVALALVGCAPEPSDDDNETPAERTIVDVAEEAGDFGTLLTAVEAAGLTETLRGDGPFTVFAPTDAAFAALPPGTVEGLLADVPTLTDILLYHVVAGEIGSDEVVTQSLVTTVQGSDFKVTTDGGVFVNGAQVTATDIEASNGVIHVIDAVILPPEPIGTIVANDPEFSTLYAALQAADLVDTLNGPGPFTVFAPTNDAFAALPAGTVEALLADVPTLTSILLYHVTDARMPAADVVGAGSIDTLQGSSASIAIDGTSVAIDGAPIIGLDIPAANGVIHVIDAVMQP